MIKLKDILNEIRQDKEKDEDKNKSAIQTTFIVKDMLVKYAKKFIGQKFSKEEIFALKSQQKPSNITFFECEWKWTNEEGNENNTALVKKLKQGGKFAYTCFSVNNKIEVIDTEDSTELKEAELPDVPELSNDKPTDTPPDEQQPSTEDKPEEVKPDEPKKPEMESVKVQISQPFENKDGDINILKKFLSSLKIGKNK